MRSVDGRSSTANFPATVLVVVVLVVVDRFRLQTTLPRLTNMLVQYNWLRKRSDALPPQPICWNSAAFPSSAAIRPSPRTSESVVGRIPRIDFESLSFQASSSGQSGSRRLFYHYPTVLILSSYIQVFSIEEIGKTYLIYLIKTDSTTTHMIESK